MSIPENSFSAIMPSILPEISYQEIYQVIFTEVSTSIKNINISKIISEYVLLQND